MWTSVGYLGGYMVRLSYSLVGGWVMAFWADMDWEAREEVLASIQKRFAARWEKGRTVSIGLTYSAFRATLLTTPWRKPMTW